MIFLIYGLVVGIIISSIYYLEIVDSNYIHYILVYIFLILLSFILERNETNGLLLLLGMSSVIILVVIVDIVYKT